MLVDAKSTVIFRSSAGGADDGTNIFGVANFDVGCRRIDVALIVDSE